MADYNIIVSQTIDFFLATTPYNNFSFTTDRIFVSEGAVLSQPPGGITTVLYASDIIIGENSTGTATIKDGEISITKPGFTLHVNPVIVIPDAIAPGFAFIDQVTAYQETLDILGQTSVALEWIIPTVARRFTEEPGIATGTAQFLGLSNTQLEGGSEIVWEVTGVDPSGGNTVLTRNFSTDQNLIKVADSTNFYIGQLVSLDSGGGQIGYYKVLSVNGTEIMLNTSCNFLSAFPAGSTTVNTVLATEKTLGVDYDLDYLIGQLEILPGQFTSGSNIVISYLFALVDLNRFEVYRAPGDHPVEPLVGNTFITKEAVTSFAGFKVVSTAIPAANTSYSDLFDVEDNGTTWTYYLFAVDASSPENSSYAISVLVETIPSIPQNLTVGVGSRRVYISWDGPPVISDANTNGYNVYRTDSAVFDSILCKRVNSVVVAKGAPFFEDSDRNVTDRRPDSAITFPENGETYSYKIEAEDTVTDWDIGTYNQDIEVGLANLVASKVV